MNYYLRRPLSEEQKAELKKAIDRDEYTDAENILRHAREIHIGKRHWGWRFLWDAHYFQYFSPSRESLMEFLKSGTIYNEEGKAYTFDEFMQEIDYYLNTGDTLASYYKKFPGEDRWRPDPTYIAIYQRAGVYPDQYGETHIDGLRFSCSEDFA